MAADIPGGCGHPARGRGHEEQVDIFAAAALDRAQVLRVLARAG
jgi:hypothetical protein